MAIEIFTSNGSGLVKLDRNIKNYSHYKLKPQYETQNIPLFPKKNEYVGRYNQRIFRTYHFAQDY